MIIDSFTFFNELDMLDSRLSYLSNIVDYFIIVEANVTHTGKPKDFLFQQNMNKYSKYLDKIIYSPYYFNNDILNLDLASQNHDFLKSPRWIIERSQRNHITSSLHKFKESDFLIIGDVDEIPNKDTLTNLVNSFRSLNVEHASLIQEHLTYDLQHSTNMNFLQTVVSTVGATLKAGGVENVRTHRYSDSYFKVVNGGWHLSYFFNPANILNKLENFAHQEFNTPERRSIEFITSRVKQHGSIYGNETLNTKLLSSYPDDFLSSFSNFTSISNYL